jgi:hypothetical protein
MRSLLRSLLSSTNDITECKRGDGKAEDDLFFLFYRQEEKRMMGVRRVRVDSPAFSITTFTTSLRPFHPIICAIPWAS